MDLQKLVRQNIISLKPYSSARDEFSGEAGVFLDANENPFGDLNRYPDPHQQTLKDKLKDIKKLTSKQVFIGNGSDEVIDLLIRIFFCYFVVIYPKVRKVSQFLKKNFEFFLDVPTHHSF